jgi:hypothetical protein
MPPAQSVAVGALSECAAMAFMALYVKAVVHNVETMSDACHSDDAYEVRSCFRRRSPTTINPLCPHGCRADA